jgi:hypothetical protein
MFRSVYSVSLCCSVYCLCVNVYWTNVMLTSVAEPANTNTDAVTSKGVSVTGFRRNKHGNSMDG